MKANHRVVPRGQKTIKRYKSHVPYQWAQRREHKSSVVHASPNSNSCTLFVRLWKVKCSSMNQTAFCHLLLFAIRCFNSQLTEGSRKYFHSGLHTVTPLSRLYSYSAIKFNSVLEKCALLGSHAACHLLRGESLKSRTSVLVYLRAVSTTKRPITKKKTGNTVRV